MGHNVADGLPNGLPLHFPRELLLEGEFLLQSGLLLRNELLGKEGKVVISRGIALSLVAFHAVVALVHVAHDAVHAFVMIAILARHSTLRDALFAVVKAWFLRCVSFYVAVNAFSTLILVRVHAFKAGIVIVATALLFALGFACLTLCITLFRALR